ncbi:hypothetical protein [Microtetraspora malaysiensis]
MASQSMAIVVLHLYGGGASPVGGCGLVRQMLRTAGGLRAVRRRGAPAP